LERRLMRFSEIVGTVARLLVGLRVCLD
jgi:hypothetical protein